MRFTHIIPTVLASSALSVFALNFGELCDPTPVYKESWAYDDSCDDVYLYCDASTRTCNYKGCTNTDYIKGWDISVRAFPDRCNGTTFCPDNKSKCTEQVTIGSQCEVQRDDECIGTTSICLNKTCFVKGAPLGGNCGADTSTYTSYDAAGDAVQQTIIRDNCTDGSYCSSDSKCIVSKDLGTVCDQDRECVSGTCSNDGICSVGPDVFHKIANWLWGILATAIVLFVCLVLGLLWILHRYQSRKEHAKILRFFGDNEEFAKYAMMNDDDANSAFDTYSDSHSDVRVGSPFINNNDSKHSLVYLTTPDYQTSQSLTLKTRQSVASNLNMSETNNNNSTSRFSPNNTTTTSRAHTPDTQH